MESKFSVEGISLGDSLLDFFSLNEIKVNIEDLYKRIKDKTFIQTSLYNFSFFKEYKGLDVTIKDNDPTYRVYAIGGPIEYINFNPYNSNFDLLIKKQEEIAEKYLLLFPDAVKKEESVKHPADPSRKSIMKYIGLRLKSNENINIELTHWSDKVPYKSQLKVGILSEEFNKWISLHQYSD